MLVTSFVVPGYANAQDEESELARKKAELAKAAQNPIANMISLHLQNNTNFGVGPDWTLRLQLQFLFPK
jgi:hypothetical protein